MGADDSLVIDARSQTRPRDWRLIRQAVSLNFSAGKNETISWSAPIAARSGGACVVVCVCGPPAGHNQAGGKTARPLKGKKNDARLTEFTPIPYPHRPRTGQGRAG